MKLLVVGDIVGAPGRLAFSRVAARMKATGAVDAVVANAENAAGGKGITSTVGEELFAAGADVLTMGDHTFDQKESWTYFDREPRLVRPANFAPGCPGHGVVTVETPAGPLSVINLVGRVFMNPYDCPFRTVDAILKDAGTLARIRLVDMHAEATSEKIVMGRYVDGRVTACLGTHTHVQTSDERVLPGGTAYMTDLGMTGPRDSALGRELDSVIRMFTTGMRESFKIAKRDIVLEGAVLQVDDKTGRAKSIKRIRKQVES
ncbi:MAG: TIGR00282 family metallophosphoesterase [Kiritimatiellae bacterium]|nr:TIGR00282 family metallophosphoesterase [Kiritimatiellia bacterium]